MAQKKKKKPKARWGNQRSSGPSNTQRYSPPKTSGPKQTTLSQPKPPAPVAPALKAQVEPFDPIYNDEIGMNQMDLDTQLAQIQYGRGQIAQQYGFNQQGGMDASNPYNLASMLERSYHQGQRGTLNSMAGRGQLYAGSTQRGLDEGTFQYSRNRDSLQRQARDAYFGLDQQELTAKSGKLRSDLNARRDKLDRAQNVDPVDPGSIDVEAAKRLAAATKQWSPQEIASTTQRAWDRAARKRRRSMRNGK